MWACTIARKGSLDGGSPNDASTNCRITRHLFKGVEGASWVVDQEAKPLHVTLTKLLDRTLRVQYPNASQQLV